MGGQTHLSVSGGRDARKAWLCLTALCLCASQLAVRADKKGGSGRAADSGFIPRTPSRLLPVRLSLCSCRSGSWPALRHQKLPDGLIGTVFSKHLQKLVKLWSFWQWFKEICHYGLNRVHLIYFGRLEMPGHCPNASLLTDVSVSTLMYLLAMNKQTFSAT